MMDKKDTSKTVKDESCLTVSDWVAFLTSEKHGIISHVLSFGAFLVALIAILLVTGEDTGMRAIAGGIIALGFVVFGYFKVLRPLQQRGRLAEDILTRVMSIKLKDESSIREEWEAGLATLKRPWRRRGRSDK